MHLTTEADDPKDVIERAQLLQSLAHRINEHFTQASYERTRIRALCLGYAREALLCGQALNQAKGMQGHGRWMRWFRECCPRVSYETAVRYMRAARSVTVTDLERFDGLKDLYLALGILPEEARAQGATAAPGFGLMTLKGWFGGLLKRIAPRHEDILSLPQAEREATAALLEPLVKLHAALTRPLPLGVFTQAPLGKESI